MHLVDIPLNRYIYRFRRLSWIEASQIKFTPGEDQRITVLAHALHDVSGFPVESVADATRILQNLRAELDHIIGHLPMFAEGC